MKHLRKLIAAALTMVMALAISTVAYASDYVITVKNDNANISINGKTYTAYKLFDAVYSEGTSASYTIKKDNYFYTDTTAKAVLDKYFDFTAAASDNTIMVVTPKTDPMTDALARQLADELKPCLASATGGITSAAAANEQTTIDVGAPGYFIVDGGATATQGGSEVTAAVALTNTNKTATLQPKADAPGLTKTIDEINDAKAKVYESGKTGNGSVGDKVEYKLQSKVPNMTGYAKYSFVVNDTMSDGLTFNDDIAITIGGTTYTAWTKSATVDATSGATSIVITFDPAQFVNNTEGADIVITYSATINQNALVVEENDAKLKYSHDPYDENLGKPEEVLGETPDQKTKVYVTNIKLKKVDGSDPTKTLSGAKFSISGISNKVAIINQEMFTADAAGDYYRLKDGTYTKTAPTTATADQYDGDATYSKVEVVNKDSQSTTFQTEGWVKSDDGTLEFNGLGEGTYTITELVAPDGYNLLENPVTVVVSFTSANGEGAFTATVDGKDVTINDNVIEFDVKNNSGTTLPSTGGIGTTIFYIVGGIMVVAAGALLITKKRVNE